MSNLKVTRPASRLIENHRECDTLLPQTTKVYPHCWELACLYRMRCFPVPLVAVMGKCLVGFRHPVGFLPLPNGTAGFIRGIHQFIG